jgi:hypothetical protein
LWAWNDRRSELEAVICQQQGIYATARLTTAITDETDVPFDHFEIQSFSPFNLVPAEITAAQNGGTAHKPARLSRRGRRHDHSAVAASAVQVARAARAGVSALAGNGDAIDDHASGQNIGATDLKEGGVSRSRGIFFTGV